MKTFKKSLAVLIALVMAFSSFSILASATLGDGKKRTMDYMFKFFDENGNETTKVYPGQTVTARLYMETDFVVATHELFILFDSTVLEAENTHAYDNSYDPDLRGSEYWVAYEKESPATFFDLPDDTYDNYGHIYLQSNTGVVDFFSMDQWVYEWNFIVIADEESDAVAHIFLPQNSIRNLDNVTGANALQKVEDDERAGTAYDKNPNAADPSVLSSAWADNFEVYPRFDANTVALGQAQGDADAADLATVEFDNDTYYSPYLTISDTVTVYYYLPNIIEDAVSGNGYANYGEGNDGDAAWQVAKQSQSGSGTRAKYYFNQNYVVEGMAAYGTAPVVPSEPGILQDIPEGYYFAGWTVYTGDEEFNPADADLSFMATKPAVSATATITDGRDYSKIHGQTGNNAKNGVYSLKETLAADPNSAVMKPLIVDNYTDANGDEWLIDDEGYFVELLALILPLPAASFEVYYDVDDEEPAQTGAIEDKAAGDTVTYADVDFDIPEGYEIDTDNTEAITLDENGGGVLKIYLKKSTYYVTFKADGEVIGEPVPVLYGEEINLIKVPEKTNYTGYWCTDAACEDAEHAHVPATMPAEDVTLYAVYTINAFELTFVVTELDGSETTYGPEMVSPGEDINDYIPSIDEIAGYEFSWSDYDDTMPAANTTITGSYTALDSELIYVLDGEDYDVESDHVTGETVTLAGPATVAAGYTFDGWYADGDCTEKVTSVKMAANSTTVYGKSVAEDQTITYIVDGETYKTETYKTDAAITPVAAPEKAGYTFSGWDNIPATMPAGGATVTGTFTADDQTITYVVDGETYKTETYKTDAAITPVAAPEKAGYTFSGWDNVPATMPAGGATVTGTFTADDQTITYIVDGETYTTETYKTDAAITPVAAPEKAGYTFSGWDNVPATMPAGGVTVTGTFTADDQTITYYVDGEVYTTETYKTDAEITPVAAPEKAGYTFSGWSEIPATMPAGGVTVTGTFTANAGNLTYVVDGATSKVDDTHVTGDVITLDYAPVVAAGYEFDGWYATEDCTGDKVTTATLVAEGTTVYGKTVAVAQTLTVVVDGEESTSEVATDETFILEAVPEKTGYTGAWAVTDAEGNDITPDAEGNYVMPAGGATATAVYTANTYELTFEVTMPDGTVEATDPVEVEYGADVNEYIPEVDEIDGYEFEWAEYEDTMPAADVTITGSYTALASTLIYVLDGAEYATDADHVTGEVVTLAGAATVAAGYTFDGWYADADCTEKVTSVTMAADSTTVYGKSVANAGNLTYVVDGAVSKVDDTYVTGDVITLDYTPEVADGYEFDGWYATEDCTGDKITTATLAAEGTSVYGKTVAVAQTLTVVVDGEETTSEVATDETFTLDAVPEKTGYTGAWEVKDAEGNDITPDAEGNYVMPAGGATATAVYTANTYELTFEITYPNGDVETSDPVEVEFGADVNEYIPEVDEIDGYEFAWAEYEDTMPAADTVITGSYTALPQSLTVVIEGEETTSEVLTGDTFTLDAVPEKTGYTGSWIVADGEGNEITPDAEGNYVMPAGGAIAEAVYTPVTSTITVEFEDGTTIEIEYSYDSEVEEIEAPEVDGKEFDYWEAVITNEDGEEETVQAESFKDLIEAINPTDDVVIRPVYTEAAPVEYIVTYVDGDTVLEELGVYAGQPIDTIDEPEKEGYTFAGWVYTDAEGNELAGDLVMPECDLTATATWEVNEYTVTYVVDGEETDSMTVCYGEEIDTPEEPEKAGYTFVGWTYTDAEGNEYTEATMPAYDLTATAEFTADDQEIVYYVDGVEYARETYKTDAEITAIEEPTKAGYTFSGWDNVPATMPADGAEVNGTFTADDQTLTVVVDGEETTSEVATDETFTLDAVPEKTGYTGTWEVKDAEGNDITPDAEGNYVMPAGGATATAVYTANTYALTFDADNGTEAVTSEVEFGAAIETPADPEKEGFVFLGWADAEGKAPADYDGMPANDVTFTAQWEEAANAIVKLMPADGAMSTMIERAGVVETADADRVSTWATAGRRQSFYAPNGVTNVIVADAETYNYKTAAEGETYETYFVYGLDAGLKDTDLASYVTVAGDGTYEVTNVGRRGEVKTGTVISVYDKEGVLVEQFYVVIYGDVNCDGKVNASDATVLDNEVETRNWSVTTSDNYVAYITRAANLDRNTSISASDSVSINSFVEGTGNIDQSAGYYVAG